MKEKIAIIGVSLQVGNAKGLEDFWKLIQGEKTCFHPLSPVRRRDIFDRYGEFEVALGAQLDRIDLFDNAFFNISDQEAVRMDPEQRLMMQHAVKAVYNAGYQLKELRGKRIGIFHTLKESRYKEFFNDVSEFDKTGHHAGMIGTRIANFMDWSGPVIGVNTACSSSLSALYYACQSIANEESIMALAGGVILSVSAKKGDIELSEVASRGQFIPFNEDPGEVLLGEGVCCVLLKRLEEAVRDGDPIHAVIRGGAINHCGAHVQNIVSPSPGALTEVIRLAWKNSGIHPADVGFIESIGIGSQLGDPIEYNAVAAAFEGVDMQGRTCAISAVKGQIGHLGILSGLLGLMRVLLALQHKCLPSQPGIEIVNAFIDEKNSPIKVQRQVEAWDSKAPRIAGVNSHGLTGTNVHMVLEEYIPAASTPEKKQHTYLIKVGGTTPGKAANAREYLKKYLRSNPEVDLAQLCYTVNKWTEDHRYGELISFREHQELTDILEERPCLAHRGKAVEQQVLLFNTGVIGYEHISPLLDQSEYIRQQFTLLLESTGHSSQPLNLEQQTFLLQYAIMRSIIQAGFTAGKIIGAEEGKLISYLLAGKLSVGEALLKLETDLEKEPFKKEGFIQFLRALSPSHKHFIVVVGSKGEMVQTLKAWLKENTTEHIRAVFIADNPGDWSNVLKEYYNTGGDLDLERLYGKEALLHNMDWPVFEEKRYWPEPAVNIRKEIPYPVVDPVLG